MTPETLGCEKESWYKGHKKINHYCGKVDCQTVYKEEVKAESSLDKTVFVEDSMDNSDKEDAEGSASL
jgi:hypothetical protein